MAGPIRIAVLANAAQAKREIGSVETRGKKFGKVMQVAGRVAAAGLLVVGAAAVKSAQAAATDQQAQSKLAQTLRTGAKATAAQIAQTEKFVTAAGKQFGVTDDELRPALGKLAQATGSVAKAQKLASIAMDVSTGSGKSLESVSAALAKAQATGNVKALAKFGVATKDAHGKTLSLARATQELANKYKGAASKNAQTAAGKQKILSVQMGELQEQIGAGLLPVMQKLAAIGLKTVAWISNNTGKAKVLGVVLLSLAAAVLVANVAQKVYTASTILFNGVAAVVRGALVAWRTAQIGLNIALAANPIGVIVLAIAALVVGIVIAYKKSDKFRAIVNKAFTAIKNAIVGTVSTVVGFLKSHWPLILAILAGPVGIAVLAVVKNWDKIKNGAKGLVDGVKSRFGSMLTFLKSIPGKIAHIFENVWSGLAGGLKSAINNVLHLPLKIPRIDTHIPGVGKVGGQTLIPALAHGGIVNRATLALIGEAGPEAVIPLDRLGSQREEINISATVTLSAQQLSQLQRGREIRIDLDAWDDAGGRSLVS